MRVAATTNRPSRSPGAGRLGSERPTQVLRQLFNQDACTLVARPTRDEPGYWVGAASIVHDHRSGWYIGCCATNLDNAAEAGSSHSGCVAVVAVHTTTWRRLYVSARYRDGGDSRAALDKVRGGRSPLGSPSASLTRPQPCLRSAVPPRRASAAASWPSSAPRTAAQRGTSFTAGAKYGTASQDGRWMGCAAGPSLDRIAESLAPPSRPP